MCYPELLSTMSSMPLPARLLTSAIWLAILTAMASSHALAADRIVPNNEWVMISIPGDPGATGTVAQIIGDDLPIADIGETWAMFRWPNPSTPATTYQQLTGASRLYAGDAYWLTQISGQAVTIDLPASVRPTRSEKIRGCNSLAGCSTIELKITAGQPVGWMLVGLSQSSAIKLSDVRFLSENGACRSGCTLSQAFDENLVVDTLYRHNNESMGYDLLREGDTTAAWEGFWLGVLPGAANQRLTLQIPNPLPASQTPDLSKYEMVFNDEFAGPALDASKWNTGLLWGPYIVINNEEQLYVDSLGMHQGHSYDPFSFTPQGTLKITASATSDVGAPPPMPNATDPIWKQYLEYRAPKANDPPYVEDDINYLSGIITSYESFKFSHGYVEARVKVPRGQGLWPAFWTLPTHYVADVPEIDVMEYIGQFPNEVYHTYHYFDVANNWKAIRTPSYTTIGPDFSEDFHVYSMSWDPEQIIWYVDGIEARRVDSSEYDIPNQAMYLLANLAVGGNWPGAPDASTQFPAVYELDYIRAYKKKLDKPVNLNQYKLVFSDNFSGSGLDADKWSTRFIWGPFLSINNEEQHYIDSNGIDANMAYSPFSVANGKLTITAAPTGTQSPINTVPPVRPPEDPYWADKPAGFYQPNYTPKDYTSGIITSRESFQFTHGYAEIRAQVPAGDGLWPAFWLLNSYYVGPQPEIDIMEIIGENPGEVAHTYHWTNSLGQPDRASFRSQGGSGLKGFGDGFHTFGVQWTHDTITWYVDGQETASFTDPAVSYQVMYVIANLAVGGDFNTKAVDTANLPAELVIDYIKVYQEKPVQ